MNQLEEKIGYIFKRPELLDEALTHSSYANEHKTVSNERLEFLGDSVLSIIISDRLFKLLPDVSEGDLTKTRARIVREETLVKFSNKINLGSLIKLGRGEAQSGGRNRASIIADAFEAVLGAIYLDGGLEASRRWLFTLVKDEIETAVREKDMNDYKTHLQELVQSEKLGFVRYILIDKSGPVHDSRFVMQAYIKDKAMGIGEGTSKKEAEQKAAKATLETLANEAL